MTATQRLADHLLDGKLAEYVETRRAQGLAWRRICLDLRDDVGIDITYETLRAWFPNDRRDQRSDAVPTAGDSAA